MAQTETDRSEVPASVAVVLARVGKAIALGVPVLTILSAAILLLYAVESGFPFPAGSLKETASMMAFALLFAVLILTFLLLGGTGLLFVPFLARAFNLRWRLTLGPKIALTRREAGCLAGIFALMSGLQGYAGWLYLDMRGISAETFGIAVGAIAVSALMAGAIGTQFTSERGLRLAGAGLFTLALYFCLLFTPLWALSRDAALRAVGLRSFPDEILQVRADLRDQLVALGAQDGVDLVPAPVANGQDATGPRRPTLWTVQNAQLVWAGLGGKAALEVRLAHRPETRLVLMADPAQIERIRPLGPR